MRTIVTCPVCLNDVYGSDCFSCYTCSGVACKSCTKSYLETLIRDGQVKSITCPINPGCHVELTPAQIASVVDKATFRRYDRLLFQLSIESMDDIIYCPRCQNPVIITKDNENDLNNRIGECATCSFVFCTICGKTFHGVNPCQYSSGELRWQPWAWVAQTSVLLPSRKDEGNLQGISKCNCRRTSTHGTEVRQNLQSSDGRHGFDGDYQKHGSSMSSVLGVSWRTSFVFERWSDPLETFRSIAFRNWTAAIRWPVSNAMATFVGSVCRVYRKSIPTVISVGRKVNAIGNCSKVSQKWTSGSRRRDSSTEEEEAKKKKIFYFYLDFILHFDGSLCTSML